MIPSLKKLLEGNAIESTQQVNKISSNVLLCVLPSSYYELKFKVGEKWYKGYYEHLWGGSFRAFAWWTKHFSKQKHFDRSEVSEWHYT